MHSKMIQDQCNNYKSVNDDLNYQIFQLIGEKSKLPNMVKIKSYIIHLNRVCKQVN